MSQVCKYVVTVEGVVARLSNGVGQYVTTEEGDMAADGKFYI